MKNDNFERLLSTIRNEHVADETVARAGDRVWGSLTEESPVSDLAMRTLRSCADFQALIPGYLDKKLAAPRALLFEDHVHGCVPCRRALERAGSTETQTVWRPKREAGFPVWRWAMGAAAVVAIAFGTLSYNEGILPGQHPVRGEVQSVNGSLYAISGDDMRLVPAGYHIANGAKIRTAKGSTAVLRLTDGSLVEMGERAGVSVSRGWKGTTIQLDDGQVIVQAAKQRTGHLFVATDDSLVSVKGTIFSVNHGTKGSRVAVIEGVVRVDSGENTTELHPGEETTSGPSVGKVPIQREIAWSKDSAKYLALLGDFTILQKQFAAIPGPGLRYSSDLLPLVPENTVVYAAIPNLQHTLEEASRLFEDRLRQSPALRDWWKQEQKGNGPKLVDVLGELQTFSSYLGDEIVFSVGKTGNTYSSPVILARVRQPGLEGNVQLEGFLQKESKQLGSTRTQVPLVVVHDLSAIPHIAGEPLLVYLNNDLLIASPRAADLQQAAARIKQGAGSFQQTPFYEQISQAYQQGAEWLFCANMEQIFVESVHADGSKTNLPTGMGDVRYLTMEHREVGGKTDNQAALTFASDRQGVASWLAAPASMGSLEFVSPDASMVTSAVIKNPRSILEEMFQMIGAGDSNFNQGLADFEAKSGVRVLDDIAAPLGGEVTMAFDGPLVPTPRWKLVFEVYDPSTLQATIEKLVQAYNREKPGERHPMQTTQQQIGSRTYYTIRGGDSSAMEIDYTFVDNYLVAAPDVATISRAIEIRQAGFGLTHSTTFQALMPSDGYTNFSGVFYHNLGPVVKPIADQLKASGALTRQQRQSIDALTANSAPGLIYAYGERDRIAVASNTGFMGFDLGTLLTMGQHGPFFPQMMLGGAVSQSTQAQ
jgi:hypothetical protein